MQVKVFIFGSDDDNSFTAEVTEEEFALLHRISDLSELNANNSYKPTMNVYPTHAVPEWLQ